MHTSRQNANITKTRNFLLPGSAVWLPLLLTLLIMLPKGHKLLEELFLRIFAEPDLSREVNLMTCLASVCSKLRQDFFSTAVKSSHVFQIHPNLLLKDINESVHKVVKLFCTEAKTRALSNS